MKALKMWATGKRERERGREAVKCTYAVAICKYCMYADSKVHILVRIVSRITTP